MLAEPTQGMCDCIYRHYRQVLGHSEVVLILKQALRVPGWQGAMTVSRLHRYAGDQCPENGRVLC